MKYLVIAFYLASALWIVWFAIDEFNLVFPGFLFEFFGDELFTIVQIDLSGGSAFSQSPLKRIDCLFFSLVKICFGDYAVA